MGELGDKTEFFMLNGESARLRKRRSAILSCGWCKDRWGLSWQITPRALTDALTAGGAEARREFEAMMSMEKIDVATIEAVRRG